MRSINKKEERRKVTRYKMKDQGTQGILNQGCLVREPWFYGVIGETVQSAQYIQSIFPEYQSMSEAKSES